MIFARCLILSAFALASTLNAAGQTDSKPVVDPAGWVPKDALAYVGIADIKELSARFRATAFYMMMQDPGAKESWREVSILLKFYEEFKGRLARSLETEPELLDNPLGGPMALYVPAPRGEGNNGVRLVLVAGVGDAELMRRYYDQATRKIREIADKHETVAFGSHTIDHFSAEVPEETAEKEDTDDLEGFDFGVLSAGEEGLGAALERIFGSLLSSDAIPQRLVLCLTEDRLIVAPTTEDVIDVLRRERTEESLVASEAYQTLLREFRPLGGIRLLINLQGLFKMMVAAEGQEAEQALTMLGAESMRGVIGHVLLGAGELESKLEALLLLRGERTGLAKIFSMENRSVVPPANVPGDALVYASVNANVVEILDELERMVRQDDPQSADELRASVESIELPEGQTLRLREEVLENLRGPVTFTMSFQRPVDQRSTHVRVVLGHRDQQAMIRFLELLARLMPGTMVTRQVRETPVYDIPLGGLSLAPTTDAIITGTTDAVLAALESAEPTRSLAEAPEFKRVAALAPREAWGLLYVDSRRVLEAALALAEKQDAQPADQLANPVESIASRILATFATGLDQNQTEAARRLSKYRGPSIMTAATTPDGIRVTRIQLVPHE